MPINTFSPKKPFKGKIKSVERIVGPKATGETCHIVIETNGDIPFWEGQSYGVIPPVSPCTLLSRRLSIAVVALKSGACTRPRSSDFKALGLICKAQHASSPGACRGLWSPSTASSNLNHSSAQATAWAQWRCLF